MPCFLLGAQLRGKSCRPFNSDTKVRIEYPDHTRFYYPDALVVCQPNPPTDHFQDQPVVISRGSQRFHPPHGSWAKNVMLI